MSLQHNLQLKQHFSRIFSVQVEQVDIFTSVMTSICHMIWPLSAWTPTIFPHLTPLQVLLFVFDVYLHTRGVPRVLFVLMTLLACIEGFPIIKNRHLLY